MTALGDDLVPSGAAEVEARPGPDDLVPHRPQEGRGWLLEGALSVLQGVTWLSPLPVGRERLLWVFRRPRGRAVAEAYTVVWVAALVVSLVFADTAAGPYVAGVALFRYGDVVSAQAVVLLDPVGLRIGDPRRSLALAGLHVAEMALVAATVYRWQLGQRIGAAFMSGFDAVTLNSVPGQAGNWLDAARLLAGVGTAVVVLGAVAAVVRLSRGR